VTAYAVPPPPVASLAIAGSGARFPVRRVYCVGRNYAAHVREMNGGTDPRDPPFFFLKPADAVVETGGTVPYPPGTESLHHEVELVAAIGTGGASIPAAEALGHVGFYGVGIDLTRRDLQTIAKGKGWPWEMGKAFDHSAPIGPLTPAAQAGHHTREISLTVDGRPRQTSTTDHMIWSVAEIVARLSEQYRLVAGDIILTGTPEGVGPVGPGAVLEAQAAGLAPLTVTIGGRA
jgi:fumarylpyruvate hydrolase